MNEFLQRAEDLLAEGKVADSREDFQLVFDTRERLKAADYEAGLELDDLESLFAAFEMAHLLSELGDMSPAEVAKLPRAITKVIERTLGESVTFPIDPKNRALAPSPEYKRFTEVVAAIASKSTRSDTLPVSILTFNYDPCLDDALEPPGLGCEYCLKGPGSGSALKLLKLHGSLNWLRCPDCNRVTHWDIRGRADVDVLHTLKRMQDTGQSEPHYRLAGLLKGPHKYPCCGREVSSEPFLVPPTYNKGYRYAEIAPVWRAAARELADARNVYVCGFSLRDTDPFFRYLYALGATGPTTLKRFWVFDPEPNVGAKFEGLLGPGAKRAYRYEKRTFGEMITHLAKELQL